MFDDLTLKVLDLRSKPAFKKQHLVNSANIPWQELAERMNELSSRPSYLNRGLMAWLKNHTPPPVVF